MSPGWVRWETIHPQLLPPTAHGALSSMLLTGSSSTQIFIPQGFCLFSKFSIKCIPHLAEVSAQISAWPNCTPFHSILPLFYFVSYHLALPGRMNADIYILICLPLTPQLAFQLHETGALFYGLLYARRIVGDQQIFVNEWMCLLGGLVSWVVNEIGCPWKTKAKAEYKSLYTRFFHERSGSIIWVVKVPKEASCFYKTINIPFLC